MIPAPMLLSSETIELRFIAQTLKSSAAGVVAWSATSTEAKGSKSPRLMVTESGVFSAETTAVPLKALTCAGSALMRAMLSCGTRSCQFL